MFVSPSKIKKNRILRGRTISFETVQKTKGNMVFVPTSDKKSFTDTIGGTLFRPMQLMCIYTPRRVKPLNKAQVIIDQKEYYAEIREMTNGKMKKGKTMINAYAGQNLVFDIYNEYTLNKEALTKRHSGGGIILQQALKKYMENLISTASDDSDYTDVFLVFPLDKYIEDFKRKIEVDPRNTDPMVLFLKSIHKGTINMDAFAKVKLVIFYNPNADALIAMDLHDKDFKKEFDSFKLKLYRLNNFNNGTDDLSDVDANDEEDLSEDDIIENKKEQIKQVVFSKVAKTIRANNLTDFEAASEDEKEIISTIDKKIDDYLAKDENLQKPFSSLVDEIEKDNDVKSKAIRYVESKKSAAIRLDTHSKGLEKETEVIGSLQDLDVESDENVADKFDVDEKYFDERMEVSHLSSIDDEYNKKFAMKDLTSVVSAFSNSSSSPLTVDSMELTDSSTHQNNQKTLNVRYKTDDGKPLTFQIDVPDIVDKRFFYLGGNKKFIKKQLVRLPIVKTKADRVEITTNYNKMTLERTSGKLFRENIYLLKKLKEMKENPAVEILYGYNDNVNSARPESGRKVYSSDFQYEELGMYISHIKTPKYYVCFNRATMDDEIALLDIDEDIITRERTPLALMKVGDTYTDLIFIEDEKIYKFNIAKKETTLIKESMFKFLTEDVLKLDMSTLPPVTKKGFVYTTVKFLATKYTLLELITSIVTLKEVMDRYKVDYYLSKNQVKNNQGWVEVKFKDTFMYFKDEIKNTLLLNALFLMHPENYNWADFDTPVPYTQRFMETLGDTVGVYTRNTNKVNLEVYIDPITREILKDLKLPTDVVDVLLYANTLLVGNQYKPQNDMTNYRVRGNELVSDVLYKILADSYRQYRLHKMNGRPTNLSIPRGALISELQGLPNVNDHSTLNPVKEAEEIAQMSAKGFTGVNINDAYTLEMRAYDDSMNGFVSGNSTPYSGQAGITRGLSYDPKITSVRGYIPYIDQTQLSAANMLSPTELLSSFTSAGADSPRQA